jgi:hypothetical protein
MELNDDAIGALSFSELPVHPMKSSKIMDGRHTLGMITFRMYVRE